jgi:small subunit ribosomal protein S3
MGQKTHPTGIRLGYIRRWDSQWFEDRGYAQRLHEDIGMRQFIKKELQSAGISKVRIERAANKVKISIYTPRPGLIIGKKGAGIDGLRKKLQDKKWGEKRAPRRGVAVRHDERGQSEIFVNIHEVRKAETDAQLVAENVAMQLERRVAFRRAMKKAVQTALKFGAKGIRIACSRLGGGEMSRYEWYREGRVPLHTLRADIDYGFFEAKTTFGIIGVKCWIFKGEILPGTAV